MKKATVSKPKTKKIKDILQIKPEPIGLCSCCKSLQTCTFPRDTGRPTLQCEEFDGIIPSHLKMVPRRKTTDTLSGKNNFHSPRGLCGLCEIRQACTYPKPEGGVWHCEEYQ